MSIEALHWVKRVNRETRDPVDRLVLLTMADEADTGTGWCCPSYRTIAEDTCLNKSTVIESIKQLETDGQLLVRRPDRQGRGYFNEYVLVMGRDPATLDDCWHRPAPRRATARAGRAPGSPRPEGSAPPTLPAADGSGKGRRRVAEGSAQARPTPAPAPTPGRPGAARRSSTAARTRSTVDNLPPDLTALRDALTAAGGPAVEWRLSTKQVALVQAALAVLDVDQLVRIAMERVHDAGAPDRAAAWVRPWCAAADRAPTSQQPVLVPEPCGACDGHLGGARMELDDDDRPIRPCRTCHPSVFAAAAF